MLSTILTPSPRTPTLGALLLAALMITTQTLHAQNAPERPRAREAGVVVGIMPTGPLNAITDVEGVRVGQVTIVEGTDIRTGVTAILPHPGNTFHDRVPAAIVVANGFGKLVGLSQVQELGELETPILLTCTLCVWKAADAMTEWLLAQPEMEGVRSINPLIGETNDGRLNDIRARPLSAEAVIRALETAAPGPVEEGSVGAGTGTISFGWKGGIGTSSRQLPERLGGYTVGVLVQSNYGGSLTINGAPVGRELQRYSFRDELIEDNTLNPSPTDFGQSADGSIMIVVATDAPLDSRNLERLARRAIIGLGRTGSNMSNGSGDYVIAFSTAPEVRRKRQGTSSRRSDPATSERLVTNDQITPLFQAVAEATEEAIYNSLFRATTVEGIGGNRVEALPLDSTLEILKRYNALDWDEILDP